MVAKKKVRVEGLVKKYGDVVALNRISFDVNEGDFFAIIGPSGCGKTTLLKCIAGLLKPDAGYIYIDNREVSGMPTHKRGVSLVFQEFALFPHMKVFENIAFGLRMRGYSEDKIRSEVDEVMKVVGLEGLGERYPRELSGGQQQRVAIARSLVVKPNVLLLDEPLGSLDYELQRRMMMELKQLHRKLGITFIYVTHNQDQAMVLADKIMILNQGYIEQIGPPDEIYSNPATVFVAKFVGEINMLRGEVDSLTKEIVTVKTNVGRFEARVKDKKLSSKKVAYAIRPEKLFVGENAKDAQNKIEATLIEQIYKGSGVEYLFQLSDGTEFKASIMGEPPLKMPSTYKRTVLLGWNSEDALLLDKPSAVKGIDIDRAILGA